MVYANHNKENNCGIIEFLRQNSRSGSGSQQDELRIATKVWLPNTAGLSKIPYRVGSRKFIWAPVYSCSHWLRPRNSPSPHLGSYTGALLVSQDRRHLFVPPWPLAIILLKNPFCRGVLKKRKDIKAQLCPPLLHVLFCGLEHCRHVHSWWFRIAISLQHTNQRWSPNCQYQSSESVMFWYGTGYPY